MRLSMNVSRRLLIVALLCLLPSVAAGLFTQFDLQSRRTQELGDMAMRQAEHAEAYVRAVIDTARQFGAIATRFPEIEQVQPGCGARLSALHVGMPRYAVLALYRGDGTLACASPALRDADRPIWLAELIARDGQDVGEMVRLPGVLARMLPVAVPIAHTGVGTGAGPGAGMVGAVRGRLVVGIDVDWLGRRLAELRLAAATQVNTMLVIADRAGQVLVQHAATDMDGGTSDDRLAAFERKLAANTAPGLTVVPGRGGRDLLAAYIPHVAPADPIYVRVSIPANAATAEIDSIALRGALLVGSASLIALVLALVAGEAFIRMPAERLLAAAQRWQVGDLAARAPTREETSEFGRLSVAFNEMAAGLEQREAERARAAQLLEARVAERTAALSESNARLHVEISEREKTEAALAQAQKLQAVGRLAGGIAHDFNNLLATIMGNLELLERRIEPTQERLHTLIGRGMTAVQRGAQLTSRLLAFSRRHRTVSRAIDVNKVVGDLVTLAASTLGRRIAVSARLGAELWPAVADPSQLEAALLNLALNARDAMPNGGRLVISTENEHLAAPRDGAEAGDYVRIDVIDSGTGMSAEVLARAFEPFFTTKGPAGSGLGLSQVYGIAQQAGGSVRLRSVAGEGTTVSILLPRTVLEEEEQVGARARQRLSLPLKVLLVDDDQPVRQATSEMLSEMGCTVLEASNGEEALALLRTPGNRNLGMLVVDYAMPGLTGLQVAVMARNIGFKVPILLITGYAEFGEPDEPGGDLLAGVLRKPFSAAELEATLAGIPRVPAPAAAG